MRPRLPAVDAVLRLPDAGTLVARFGRPATLEAVRAELARLREVWSMATETMVLDAAADALVKRFATRQRLVFNMTGTVLHTNLGRAPLPPEAAEAAAAALANATTLEFDLETGGRGERDDAIRQLLQEITGAEDATVVNNNAAAVLLCLNTLAHGREAVVSRGELIEIGGSFRLPEIIARAGVRLVEVGTTNRTHERDFENAIGPQTGAVLRVHPANFAMTGYVASVPVQRLSAAARAGGVPLIEDLGSGSLVDLRRWGLPPEPMPQASLLAGVDLVTFSGDKLLGGPQAGLIVGRKELIARCNANPLKRALRLDKARLAALEAVLRLYLNPDRLEEKLPALRLLARPQADVFATARRLAQPLESFAMRPAEVMPCRSQIGSGALPVDLLPSAAVAFAGHGLDNLARHLQRQPRPVLGRIAEGRLWLDCRCLEPEQEGAFCANLSSACG